MQNLTIEERERAAYMAGNTALAGYLGDIMDQEGQIELLEEQLDDIVTLESWEKANGPANEYYDFFYECFGRLADHYPCPSVTSDHDKMVIFEAIEKGEGVTE